MMNIQFNQLLKDEEAECGVSSTEDLEAEEDDGDLTCRRSEFPNLYVSSALPRGDRQVSEAPMHSDQ